MLFTLSNLTSHLTSTAQPYIIKIISIMKQVAYLEFTEEYAAARPFYNGEECLVGHLAHQAKRVELLVLASAGLLLL